MNLPEERKQSFDLIVDELTELDPETTTLGAAGAGNAAETRFLIGDPEGNQLLRFLANGHLH
jgi:hypothetical protein